MAEFDSAEELIAAARLTTKSGYKITDAYAPFPIEDLNDALDLPASRIPIVMLCGAIIGAFLGYGMQYYATVISYPMNIGGRALPSWPGLIPVTIEFTILAAVCCGIFSLFIVTKLPRVYHPVFNHPDFRRASQDGFFLCIRAKDKRFDYVATERFLRDLDPISVMAVEK
jgi:hypothetical protein